MRPLVIDGFEEKSAFHITAVAHGSDEQVFRASHRAT